MLLIDTDRSLPGAENQYFEVHCGYPGVRDYVLDIIRGATDIFEWGKWAKREAIAN
jgi:hypothetical protein